MKILLCFLLVLFSSASFLQTRIDSLRLQLENAKTASEKSELHKEIGHELYDAGELDSALISYQTSLKLIPNTEKEKKGDAVIRIARTYNAIEDLNQSLVYYTMGKRLYAQVNVAPEKIADLYKDLGRVYYEQAQYDSAMVYYMQAKEIFEKNKIINYDHGSLYHYIGSVFKRQGNMDKACEYYQMEIDFGIEHDLPAIVADGTYLQSLCFENDTLLLRNELKALKLFQDLNDERMLGMMYNNVAVAYLDVGNLDSAYYYQNLNVIYDREHGLKSSLSLGLSNMATILIELKRYNEAEKLLAEAEELALSSQSKQFLMLERVYGTYADLYYAKGNYKEAYDYMYLRYEYEDSAMDQDHTDAIHEMELAYETEKKEAEIAKLELSNKEKEYEKEMAETEARRQSFNNKIYLIGGLLMMILMIFAFFKWRESKKQQEIIFEQKAKVEQQKELIEEKNKDITDSMIYASSIQRAIITSEEYIAAMFSDFFVFYKPRDIVSGDFYWAYHAPDGKKFIAVGDCTGHGVPGAMMSMLGSAFLNEIVIEGKERNPGVVLDKLRIQIKNAMSRKGGKDGMDMAFCCIENGKLLFAGANLPVYVVRSESDKNSGELIEIKGDKQPIGFQPSPEKPFATSEIQLRASDKIYLFSDGYADQFGGPKGKKYKYKTFKDKLETVAGMNFKEQQLLIDTEFETWKGDLEQLDDVCVMGIQI